MHERNARIYEAAAALVENSDPRARLGCCEAIRLAGTPALTWGDAHELAIRFTKAFHPSTIPDDWSTTTNWGRQWSDDLEEQKSCRVTALLLMAAIEEAKTNGRRRIVDCDDADIDVEASMGRSTTGDDGGRHGGAPQQEVSKENA